MKVVSEKDRITLTLFDSANNIAIRQNILFENLPLGRYLSFYNSIGLLNDGNDKCGLYLLPYYCAVAIGRIAQTQTAC